MFVRRPSPWPCGSFAPLFARTAVPGNLRPPRVDVDGSSAASSSAKPVSVERFFRVTWLLGQMFLLGTLWVFARRGVALARESAAGPIGTGMLLGMLGLGIVWLVQLPFGLVDLWWARRHDLSEMGYVEWALGHWLELGGTFVALSAALMIVMFLARLIGELWWIPGAAAFVAIGTAFAFAQPYLGGKTTSSRTPRCGTRRRRSSGSRASSGIRSRSKT